MVSGENNHFPQLLLGEISYVSIECFRFTAFIKLILQRIEKDRIQKKLKLSQINVKWKNKGQQFIYKHDATYEISHGVSICIF